jgi:multidrug efflux pump subunit AcrB
MMWLAALTEQNIQIAAGSVGSAPTGKNRRLLKYIRFFTNSRLNTEQQFNNIYSTHPALWYGSSYLPERCCPRRNWASLAMPAILL